MTYFITKGKLLKTIKETVSKNRRLRIAYQIAIIQNALKEALEFYKDPEKFIEQNRSIKGDWLEGHIFIRLENGPLEKETRYWLHELGFNNNSIVELKNAIMLIVVDKNEYEKLLKNI